jgi:hypothetical protein
MNIYINNLKNWLNKNPKMKQWGWFVLLWCTGLLIVIIGTYPIKWLITFLK